MIVRGMLTTRIQRESEAGMLERKREEGEIAAVYLVVVHTILPAHQNLIIESCGASQISHLGGVGRFNLAQCGGKA